MLIAETKNDLNAHLNGLDSRLHKIGFVPTMGALHPGHISLIQESKKQGHFTVCSIFVNPTQFNNASDLNNYPRTLQKDLEMLRNAGCDLVFTPSVEEIYPTEDTRVFDFGQLESILEGAFRPGHFNGVAKVVSILFDLVKPHVAYFGKKDYQQLLIVKELVKKLQLPIEIIGCPIIREADGLAMSSRNMRLNDEERKAAKLIPEALQKAKVMKAAGISAAEIKQTVKETFAHNSIYRFEYFEICNPDDLQSITKLESSTKAIGLIACFVGQIRLIDNSEL
jgi:pantoate--beta-alanine ligase